VAVNESVKDDFVYPLVYTKGLQWKQP